MGAEDLVRKCCERREFKMAMSTIMRSVAQLLQVNVLMFVYGDLTFTKVVLRGHRIK